MAALNCPACAEPASLVPLGSGDGVRAEACRRCGGIWVTGDAAPEKAFRSLTEDNREVAGRQQVRGNCATCGQRLAESDYCPPCQSSRPVLACPGCGQPMMRFPARADIAIDRCSTCQGTWFDGSELASLAACVTSPDPAPLQQKGNSGSSTSETTSSTPAPSGHRCFGGSWDSGCLALLPPVSASGATSAVYRLASTSLRTALRSRGPALPSPRRAGSTS